jgi:hypothetical protein
MRKTITISLYHIRSYSPAQPSSRHTTIKENSTDTQKERKRKEKENPAK